MNLFAHHLELAHVPVLTIFLAVGSWLGWHVMSRLCKRQESPKEVYNPPPG